MNESIASLYRILSARLFINDTWVLWSTWKLIIENKIAIIKKIFSYKYQWKTKNIKNITKTDLNCTWIQQNFSKQLSSQTQTAFCIWHNKIVTIWKPIKCAKNILFALAEKYQNKWLKLQICVSVDKIFGYFWMAQQRVCWHLEKKNNLTCW